MTIPLARVRAETPGTDQVAYFDSAGAALMPRPVLAAAVAYAPALGLEPAYQRIQALSADLRGRPATLPGITLTDLGREKCGIVAFTHPEIPPAQLETARAERAIHVNSSSRFSTLRDMDARAPGMVVRASVRCHNTEVEIDRLVTAVAEVIQAGPRLASAFSGFVGHAPRCRRSGWASRVPGPGPNRSFR